MPKKITLTTEDNIEIVGNYIEGIDQRFAILLHMMPATKESWDVWIEKLVSFGYSCLAIDERGHGESTMGGTLRYPEFTDQEQQDKP